MSPTYNVAAGCYSQISPAFSLPTLAQYMSVNQLIGAFGPTVSFWAIRRCSLALQVAISNILDLNMWAGSSIAGSSIAGSTTGPI